MPTRLAGADAFQYGVVDQAGGGEVLTAVHHAVTDAVQLATGNILGQGQDGFQRFAVGAIGDLTGLLGGVTDLPLDDSFRAAQPFGQTLQREGVLAFIDQGKLERRTTAVDHQNIAGGHTTS